jgi:hypothetical protein
MPFDVAEALKAGYSQQEIATFLGEQKIRLAQYRRHSQV